MPPRMPTSRCASGMVLKPRLAAKGLTRVYERLERPLVPVLARMEERGITVDRQILSRLSGELAQRAAALEDEIYELAGERFTIGSPKQLGDILFGKMGLPGGAKTKTGQWSTSAQRAGGPRRRRAYRTAAQDRRLAPADQAEIHLYRRAAGLHPSRDQAGAHLLCAGLDARPGACRRPSRTCRTSRSAPRKAARSAPPSSPTPGHKLISADYSQIELRVLAHIADIPQLKQAFADGVDIHAMTASEMFGVPVEGMPCEVRRRAKAINFGIIYGISAFGLANQLSIERSEAGDYIKKYFERFPGIQDYMDSSARPWPAKTAMSRPSSAGASHYPEIKSSNPSVRAFNERASINAPIQGSAADIIRRAMIRMEPALEKAGLRKAPACCCRCMTN